jgi:hypothetical protein
MKIVDSLLADSSDQLAVICEGDLEKVYPDQTRGIVQDYIRRCRELRA